MDQIFQVTITEYVNLKNIFGRYVAYSIHYNDFGEARNCYRRYSEFYTFDRRLCSPGNSYAPEALAITINNNYSCILSKLSLGSITNVVNIRVTDVPLPPKEIFYRFNDDFLEGRMDKLNAYLRNVILQVATGDLYNHVNTLCDFLKVTDGCLLYMLFINSRNDHIQSVNYSISQLQKFWKRKGDVDYRASHLSVINRFANILDNFDGEIASKVFLCILYLLHNSDDSLKRKYGSKFLDKCFRFKIEAPIVDMMNLSLITGFLAYQCAICIMNNGHTKKISPMDIDNRYALILMWDHEDYQNYFKSESELSEFFKRLVETRIPEAVVVAGMSVAYLMANNWLSDSFSPNPEELIAGAYDALSSHKIDIHFASFIYNIFSGILFDNLKRIIQSPYSNLPLSLILKRLEMDFEYESVGTDELTVKSEMLEGTGNSKEFENVIINGTMEETFRGMNQAISGIETFRWNSQFKMRLSELVYSIFPMNLWESKITRDSQDHALNTAAKILLLSPWPKFIDNSEDETTYPFWLNLEKLHLPGCANFKSMKSSDFFEDKAVPLENPVDRMPDCWYLVSIINDNDIKSEMDFKKSYISINITPELIKSRLGIYSTVYGSILDTIKLYFHYFDNLDLSLTNHIKEINSVHGYLSGIAIGDVFVENLYSLLNENKFDGADPSLFEHSYTLVHAMIEYKMIVSQVEIASERVLMVYGMGRDLLDKFVETSETCKKFIGSLTDIIPEMVSDHLVTIAKEKSEIEKVSAQCKSVLTKTLKSLLDKTNELTRLRNMIKVTEAQIKHTKGFLDRSFESSQSKMNASVQEALDELRKEHDRLTEDDHALEDQIMEGEEEVENLRVTSSSYNERKDELESEMDKLFLQQCDVRLLGFLRCIVLESRLRECLAMPYKLNNLKTRVEESIQKLEECVKNEIEQRGVLCELLKRLIGLSSEFYTAIVSGGEVDNTRQEAPKNVPQNTLNVDSYHYDGHETHYKPRYGNYNEKYEMSVLPENDLYASHYDMRY